MTTPGPSARWLGRLAAPCEAVGVLLTSIVAQRALLSALGVPGWKSTQAGMLESGEADFLVLSKLAAADQVVKYAILLGLAFAIGWWHRRRRLPAYGVTRAGRGWGELARVGVVLWGVTALIPGALQALDDHFPWIGAGPDHWALFPATWTPEFLLYMAVSSFALVPIVEELSVRGYMLNRFREDYGDAGALILTAVFFALAHTQYFKAEVLSLGMLVAIVFSSLAAGYVLIRTGSIVPCIVAHAIINFPVPPGEWSEEIAFGLALAVVLIARRAVVRWGRELVGTLAGNPAWGGTAFGLVVLVTALAATLVLRGQMTALVGALLGIGLVGDALSRWRREGGGELPGRPAPPR